MIGAQSSWDTAVLAAVSVAEKVDPYEPDLPVGVVIPTLEAVGWSPGRRSVDIRPRLVDKSGEARLIDTGAQITATKRKPGDLPEAGVRLVAVNGSNIPTYGMREIQFKINRKTYKISAVICDIKQDILGMDFMTKYKLGLHWDDETQSELFIVDKKSNIRSRLQIETVPINLVRTHHFEQHSSSPDTPTCFKPSERGVASAFEVACMKELSENAGPEKKKLSVEESLLLHEEEYANLIKKFPKLLNPTFSKTPTHGVFHKIETGNHPPSKGRRRPLIANEAKAAAGKAAWDQMAKDGVIERVKPGDNTDWASPLHLANKPGGGVRPCSDFRDLNSKTIVDSYELPMLKDFTKKISGAKHFSKVDLRSAFFNLPIWPPHKHKTTTLDPWGGTYVYNRLAFGLCSAPASWQKMLDYVLRDIQNIYIYLDDILVWAKSKQEHDRTLEKVFQRLSDNDMALSIEKCVFNKPEVEYLGYNVSESGIHPLQKKLTALENFKEPQTQKDILHFCGALNYFRTSLRGIKLPDGSLKSAAAVLQPLYAVATDKLPQKVKLPQVWKNSPALQKAFSEAKQMLSEAVTLHHPDPRLPLGLFTDASDHSVGGSLQMLTPDKGWVPLGFYSAHLSETQKKYSVFKKELLGAFKSLRHFLPDLYGKHFTIWTDHLPLKMAFESNNIPLNDPQTHRQITEIGRFTRHVEHVSGSQNVFADFLSRIKNLPDDKKGSAYLEAEVAAAETVSFQLVSLPALEDIQREDPEIKKILSGDQPKNTVFGFKNIDQHRIFCELSSKQDRPYIPASMRKEIMTSLHSVGHIGITPSISRIASEYYWPSLKHDVKDFVKKCNPCQKAKPGKKLINTGEFKVPDRRFSHVLVDIVGPLPDSFGFKYILTAICRTTRFVQAVPLRQASSSEAAVAFLHHWLALFGVPSVVTSDNGGSFAANLWKDMMAKFNIEVKYSALYRPQAVGLLERQHSTIKNSLKAAIEDMAEKHQGDWLNHLPFVLLGRRVALQPDIQASASELAFGMNMRVPGQLLHDPGDLPSNSQLQEILKNVRLNTLQPAKQTSNHSPPEKPLTGIPPEVTHVYTRQHKTVGLQSPYEGPFRIAERLSRSTVKIEVGILKSGEKRYEVRHLNDLKICHPDSLAAPVQRPALGRPSNQVASPTTTDARSQPTPAPSPQNRLKPVEPDPKPTNSSGKDKEVNKPKGAKIQTPETMSTNPHPNYIAKGPLVTEQMFNQANWPKILGLPPASRPVRTTRNPNPVYIDAIQSIGDFSRPPPNHYWSPTPAELADLNKSINFRNR